jgi:Rps23 Pro-64 3,4-dihydroxylase Tpa1-like proline 4-hydroxylase
MTPKQILDSFSETLMQDERILSAQERALVANLLQHAKAAAGQNPGTQVAVRSVITSAVGETVAQRAFAVLGESVVDHILKGSAVPVADPEASISDIYSGPVLKEIDPPGVKAPSKPMRETSSTPVAPSPREPDPPVHTPHKPPHQPQPPRPPMKEPDPPSHGLSTTVVSETRVEAAERPAVLPAKSCVLDEFLAPQEVADLTRFTLEHEGDFSTSEVVSPTAERGVINYEHRRSRVLMDLPHFQDLVLQRIKAVLPDVLQNLGMEEFSITDVEAQITASNDGDFFRFHSDNTNERVASRYLTFVYFFQREPRQFEGGELRIHDARLEDGVYVSEGSYQTIVPQQNQIVFFPCELLHEITPVKCPSRLFADSRFTLNGWLRR